MSMSDDDFYKRDRPPNPVLPEDRPRGGAPGAPVLAHRPGRMAFVIIVAIVVVIIFGIMLFP
ncbi:hypothetical protein ACFVIM_30275 [Streptomyces sp. NPDC057638]|uniref:hypothetical protein n=1 Tax=Streptomyces sp. NPDC057638 TaxID=3346190 RepID=UPI0036864903